MPWALSIEIMRLSTRTRSKSVSVVARCKIDSKGPSAPLVGYAADLLVVIQNYHRTVCAAIPDQRLSDDKTAQQIIETRTN